LKLPNGGIINASLVDATNPVVFVKAADLDLKGTETPEAMENDRALTNKLDDIRRAGSVAMGLSESVATASLANPKVAIVAPPKPFTASNGVRIEAADMDIQIRIVSMGRVHRAVTLTGGMCLAAAVKCEGFVLSLDLPDTNTVRIAHPSGVFPVEIEGNFGPNPKITALTCYRTQRCLMRGTVPVPNDLFRSSR
jgi:2-methylaconitate cis-trans-isomerase PrpF